MLTWPQIISGHELFFSLVFFISCSAVTSLLSNVKEKRKERKGRSLSELKLHRAAIISQMLVKLVQGSL